MILTNIIRASRSEPLSFVSVSAVHGSGTASGSVGLPAIVFGPLQTASQHQYVFGGGSGSGSPNALNTSASTTLDVSIPETKDFYRGLLTPVSPRTVAFFTAQGIPREILFYLFTDRLIETRRGIRREVRNDPLSPTFIEFQEYVRLAMQYGLSSETVSLAGTHPSKADHEERELSRLCFDPMFKAPEVSLKGLRPICGTNASLFRGGHNASTFIGRDGQPIALEIRPRSTFEIFNYLGRIVAAGEAGIIHLTNQEDNSTGVTPDDVLFRVIPGSVVGCFLSVAYNGGSYG